MDAGESLEFFLLELLPLLWLVLVVVVEGDFGGGVVGVVAVFFLLLTGDDAAAAVSVVLLVRELGRVKKERMSDEVVLVGFCLVWMFDGCKVGLMSCHLSNHRSITCNHHTLSLCEDDFIVVLFVLMTLSLFWFCVSGGKTGFFRFE